MMVQHTQPRFTFWEYLQLEEIAAVKHEFVNGQAWAMSGGSPEHAGIALNISVLIGNALRGKPCRAFSSDLRVRVSATGIATYPDVTVVCDSLELDPEDRKGHTVLNPTVLIEVLSPTTEDYDRGEKLGQYKLIPSLKEVVLVAHDRREIEIVRREHDGSWAREIASEGGIVRLRSLGCDLPVADVYRDPLAR
jgi:Uma2 family endonuclease